MSDIAIGLDRTFKTVTISEVSGTKLATPKKALSGIFVVMVLIIAGIGIVYIQSQENSEYTGPIEKITLASAKYLTGILTYIAEDQKYFRDNGLEVTINNFSSGRAAGEAVIIGEADISTSAGFVFVSNSFEHTDLRILGTIATKQIKELIARKDKGISTINDLIGKRIGVTKRSGAEFLFGEFLTINALSYEDIEIIDLRPTEIVESILNGSIDASFTWDPYSYEIKEELGDNAITWFGGEDFYFLLLAKADWINDHSEAAKRLMKSFVEAEDFVKNNPNETKEFARRIFGYDLEYVDSSWPNQRFEVILEQAMFVTFEGQARWRIKNNLTIATEIPNFFYYFYIEALEEVKPEAVTIFRG